jgi:MFS transporter, DHA2 family, multidrug resistance protein
VSNAARVSCGTFQRARLACSFADTAGQLIAGRAMLGLGAAALLPLSMSVMAVLFTAEERRGR